MLKRRMALVAGMAVLVLIAPASQSAETEQAVKNPEPARFIEGLANEALRVLTASRGTLAEREDTFRKLLHDDFAMGKIGRFVVGPHWRTMTRRQQAEYQKLFAEWVLQAYSTRLGGYSDEQFRILRTSPAGRRDVIVHTKIIKPDVSHGLTVDWRVRRSGDKFKIIDIYVESVSMAVTQRSEFDSVIRRHGVGGLISLLRYRLAHLSAANS
jgi:phospholipid transport system substrate-binding protein